MRRYGLIVLSIISIFLIVFGLFEAVDLSILSDPSPWLQQNNLTVGLITVTLLISDVLLPIPSSIIMVANGALFGVALGTTLSLVGTIGAFLVGYYFGYVSSPLLKKAITEKEYTYVSRLLQKWGLVAIIVTRPLPILAETTAIMTGASSLPLGRSLLAAFLGSIPSTLLYAFTGTVVTSFNNTALMFLGVLMITGVFWLIQRRFSRNS